VLGLGSAAHIVEPESLREQLREELSLMLAGYDASAPRATAKRK
jgi:predicted DNA-binding transcriptional regulator YafY